MDQDQWIVEFGDHLFGVGHEVRREVTAVELHAFNDIEFSLQRLGFFDGDHTVVADALHGFRDHGADFDFTVGGDGADLRHFLVGGNVLGHRVQLVHDLGNGGIDAALEVHRVHAGGNGLGAFVDDGLSQNRRRGGAVTGHVVGLGGNFAQHLCAHVFELVLEFDFLGNGYTVLGHAWCAEGLVENNVTAFRAEGDFHSVGEGVHAVQHLGPGGTAELYDFCSHE